MVTEGLSTAELAELARPPTSAELVAAVSRARRGEVSLETAVSELVYGRFDTGDSAWCEVGRGVWRVAVWAYRASPYTPVPPRPLEAPDVYVAVLALAPDPVIWWRIPGVSWAVLAAELGVGVRSAQHQIRDRLGFQFGGERGRRELVAAPCVRCGRVQRPKDLLGYQCRRCG